MSRRFDSFSIARSLYNKRRRELSRGIIAVKKAAQVLTDKRKRNKREKKKERLIFTEVRTVYKRKTERSLLINEVNRIGLSFKRKKD
jgi:hypothetical protein